MIDIEKIMSDIVKSALVGEYVADLIVDEIPRELKRKYRTDEPGK